jgi:hypothetical protein
LIVADIRPVIRGIFEFGLRFGLSFGLSFGVGFRFGCLDGRLRLFFASACSSLAAAAISSKLAIAASVALADVLVSAVSALPPNTAIVPTATTKNSQNHHFFNNSSPFASVLVFLAKKSTSRFLFPFCKIHLHYTANGHASVIDSLSSMPLPESKK